MDRHRGRRGCAADLRVRDLHGDPAFAREARIEIDLCDTRRAAGRGTQRRLLNPSRRVMLDRMASQGIILSAAVEDRPHLRSGCAIVLMCAAVVATYWPLRPNDAPRD